MSAQTVVTIPKADFIAASALPNFPIFTQELIALGLSVPVVSAVGSGNRGNGPDAIIILDGLAVAADLTAIDAAVAAHTGASFASTVQNDISQAEQSDDSGIPVTKASVSTGPLPAGDYQITWTAEIATSTNSTTSGAVVRLMGGKNGNPPTEQKQHTNAGNSTYEHFGGGLPIAMKDGDSWDLQIEFERIGAAGNAARCRRAAVGIVKV